MPTPAHERNAAIPSILEQIVNRAIEKDRELRYQTARANGRRFAIVISAGHRRASNWT